MINSTEVEDIMGNESNFSEAMKMHVDEEEEQDAATETVRKRGRPAKPDKPVKVPSFRGRGRPRKDGIPIPPEAPRVKVGKRGRGRPMKFTKPKILAKIQATGLGRGRPPNTTKSSYLADIDRNLNSTVNESGKKKGNRGRPRKESAESGYENESEGEERRGVGRPSTGGDNLDIVATGQGQGRPRKHKSKGSGRPRKSDSAAEPNSSDEGKAQKKRGRPSLGKSPTASKGSGQRGRPKKVVSPQTTTPDEPTNSD